MSLLEDGRPLRRSVRLGPLAALVALAAACGQAPPPGTSASPAAAASAEVVALAGAATAAGVGVEVVKVHRPAPDVVEVDLVAVNPTATEVDLDRELSDPGGGLARAALTADTGTRRVFVLADPAGAAQCTSPLGRLAPGARRGFSVRFAALSAAEHRVTLEVPGVGPLKGVTVPAAVASGSAF